MNLVRPGACVVAPTTAESRDVHGAGEPCERAFARVRRFVEDHLGEHLSLDVLASVAGLSRFHFARQFRRRTGQSPMAFVQRSRVERAKALLRAGTASVGEVAAALGFADHSHFTRTFRRLVGTSPRRFASWRGPGQTFAHALRESTSVADPLAEGRGGEP
ncbi:helix-turn-helix domain-containing protein [Anaeromyxobacter sp. Fw109-5]|uniref:helix-turn-helix domain-containing protein n=1 Tax=Anaeromyxobacter sp. (strain Fw109-5) TaxID=404589 RepID=UPI0000ED8988|nr:AraC family transcriptional regulator [Anaeromyxobacter sp. Fw109-5]ABS27545.1 helix-turn-helix- domain containing protein AraC type [Anaeromyxobacter sp. Fw109-5]